MASLFRNYSRGFDHAAILSLSSASNSIVSLRPIRNQR
jgi:hypothetical protein